MHPDMCCSLVESMLRRGEEGTAPGVHGHQEVGAGVSGVCEDILPRGEKIVGVSNKLAVAQL